MTIVAIENNTKVMTPRGEGRVQVTRREWKLISDGKKEFVEVAMSNGQLIEFRLSELTKVIKDDHVMYMTKEEFIDEVDSSHTVEELKEVINKMVEQLF